MKGTVRFFNLFKLPEKEKQYVTRKLLGYSQDEMYLVVADVKNYNEFLPFCVKSTVLDQSGNEMYANLEIGFPPVVENYTSKVTLLRPKLVRAVCYDGRLFNYLETCWKFNPGIISNPKTCIVDFQVKFEFKSILHSQLARIFFEKVVKQMEGAFIREAQRRYGEQSISSHELQH